MRILKHQTPFSIYNNMERIFNWTPKELQADSLRGVKQFQVFKKATNVYGF